LGNDARLHSLKQVILQKTEGTPFFMEEVVQELLEQGALVPEPGGGTGFTPAPTVPAQSEFHIPPTVQGVLAARIESLVGRRKSALTATRGHWPRVSVESRTGGRLPLRR